MKAAVWRGVARRDAADAAFHYATQAGLPAGDRFLAAVEQGIGHIARHPASGSSRYAIPLRIAGLRFWPLDGFPYLVFYIELESHLDIWRVLHAQRDIPAGISEAKEMT